MKVDEMPGLQLNWISMITAVAAPGVLIVAVPASADSASAGASCPSSQVGEIESDSGGSALACVATEQGGFSWVADTGAVGTVAGLEAQGYNVAMDRLGNAPLSACRVTGTRNPVTATRDDRVGSESTITISKTIQVSLDCGG